jgi:hypothetical protein
MQAEIKLPPMPEPDLSEVPHELWGQNVLSDAWLLRSVTAYGLACYRAGLEAAAQKCDAEKALGLDDERAYYGGLMAEAIRALATQEPPTDR